jgi:hypothetical protein
MTMKETLSEIADIGVEITRLSERSKKLRISLMQYHESLPKSQASALTAQVVVGTRLYHITPVTKLEGMDTRSKLIDVTVTFGEVHIES